MVFQDASRSPLPDLLAGSWALGPSVCLDLSYPPHLGITGALTPPSLPPHSPPTLHVPEELGSSILKYPYVAKSSSTHGGAFRRAASCLVCSSKSKKIHSNIIFSILQIMVARSQASTMSESSRISKCFRRKSSFIQWKPGVMRRGRILI